MIHIICNNANSGKDGIGDYTYNVYKALCEKVTKDELVLHSGEYYRTGIFNQLTSMVMSNMIKKVTKEIRDGDFVILEYPVVECNILLLYYLKRMKTEIERKGGHLILSLHEYFRTNSFRRYIIRKIILLADSIMVTDEKTKAWIINKYGKDVSIRTIPSNIYNEFDGPMDKDPDLYIFFGLISKNKALEEMLSAWKKFNVDNRKKLIILSSSPFENQYEVNNVCFYRNLGKDEICSLFRKATFCILPIIPCVSINNTTYKTALCFDCIPIGVFDNSIDCLNGHIPLKGYLPDEIYEGLTKAGKLEEKDRKLYKNQLNKIPKQTPNITALQYLSVINSLK